MSVESILVGFADQRCPITDACNHIAGVDVIEVVLWPGPVLGFAVIDFEADVVWYPEPSERVMSALPVFITWYSSFYRAPIK